MGPLAHSRRLDAIEELVSEAVEQGAERRTGGRRMGNVGYFYEPTVLSGVPESAKIMNLEPFGPVALLNSVESLDEGIGRANRLPYGLAGYGFAQSLNAANQIAAGLETGMVGINSFTLSFPETPFVGVKESGHGAENGIEGLETCLVTKFVTNS